MLKIQIEIQKRVLKKIFKKIETNIRKGKKMSELDTVKELIVKPARLEEIREEAFASTVTVSFASANCSSRGAGQLS